MYLTISEQKETNVSRFNFKSLKNLISSRTNVHYKETTNKYTYQDDIVKKGYVYSVMW